jgi:hypothetical protein
LRLEEQKGDHVRLAEHVRDLDGLRSATDARQVRRWHVHDVEHRDAVRRLQVAPRPHAHLRGATSAT